MCFMASDAASIAECKQLSVILVSRKQPGKESRSAKRAYRAEVARSHMKILFADVPTWETQMLTFVTQWR